MTSQEACAGSGQWLERSCALKYAFGGRVWSEYRFKARVLDQGFEALGEDPESLEVPGFEGQRGIEAFRVECHRVAVPPAPIRVDSHYIRYVPTTYRRFYVDLHGTFDGYLNAFSRHTRTTARRKMRKVADTSGGVLDVREYRTPEQMPEFHELAGAVSSKTYQEQLLKMGIPHSDAFCETLMAEAARDQVRGYVLFSAGAPVAFFLGRRMGRNLMGDRMGFDPVYSQLGPGTVLFLGVLKSLFEKQEFERMDMGEGEFDYKEFYSTGHWLCSNIYYFRRTAWNLGCIAAHYAIDWVTVTVRAGLKRLGLDARLRRLLHGRPAH